MPDSIITYTGRIVGPTEGAPSVEDIAVHLGRVPRWGGAGRQWWPVLLHSLLVERIVDGGCYTGPLMSLHALLHDAHEAVIGDIPTPFKTDSMRDMQSTLDTRIYRSLGLPLPTPQEREIIKLADHEAFLAEAKIVGPRETIELSHEPCPYSLGQIGLLLFKFPSHQDTIHANGKAVTFFVDRVNSLLEKV